MSYSKNKFKLLGKYSSRGLLLNKYGNSTKYASRYLSIVPLFSRILKLRYLFLGSAVGGGVAVHNVVFFFNFFCFITQKLLIIFIKEI